VTVYRRVCRILDGLYVAGGVLASLFLIAILLLIVAQMVARWTTTTFSGAPNYAGYCMAAASFLAFAHALNRGAHIRVSILLNALGFWWVGLLPRISPGMPYVQISGPINSTTSVKVRTQHRSGFRN